MTNLGNSKPEELEKPKPRITIDGQVVEIAPGETIMNVAERIGLKPAIPRYCYHPGLSIAGSCRMCQVEVEKAPKLVTACSTPAMDGQIVHTGSDKVQKARSAVMEMLLANHPLDCPVCDQAGECALQDYNFSYGPCTSKMKEEKRVFEEKTTYKISDELTLNMNRCIHCERCIRFTEEVTQTHELIMVSRGWHKEIVTAGDEGIKNDYQGCIAQICPVGAFTYKDFRFKKRVWFLQKKPTICDGCSKGCNVFAELEKNTIFRLNARENPQVNKFWMCDEGRRSYHKYEKRLTYPCQSSDWQTKITWKQALTKLYEQILQSKSIAIILGTDITNEEAAAWLAMGRKFVKHQVSIYYFNGVNGVSIPQDNIPIDKLLKQRDQTANTNGLAQMQIPVATKDTKGFDIAIHVRSGRSQTIKDLARFQVAFGVFSTEELSAYHLYLPGLTTYEKDGSFTNCDGITQQFSKAIEPIEGLGSYQDLFKAMSLLEQSMNVNSSVWGDYV